MKILFIAAAPMEFPGFLRHATIVKSVSLPINWSRQITLNNHQALLLANGAGPTRAASATKAGIEAFHPDVIVSTGFCGALSPTLQIADVISADCIVSDSSNFPAKSLSGLLSGPVRSISYVAQTADEKRKLASGGAIAVEMEAAGVAAEALRHSLPFYCVRAITDLAGETLANDFNKSLRLDGHFDTISILRVALLHPTTRIPELIRLRKRCVRAAQSLGDFFADSRF